MIAVLGVPMFGLQSLFSSWRDSRRGASQAGEQSRIPPLWTVIADGYAQRLLLPDLHEQPLVDLYLVEGLK